MAGRLRLCAEDDGRGGADEDEDADGGSGLTGIRRRIAAHDGTLSLAGPPGGPAHGGASANAAHGKADEEAGERLAGPRSTPRCRPWRKAARRRTAVHSRCVAV